MINISNKPKYDKLFKELEKRKESTEENINKKPKSREYILTDRQIRELIGVTKTAKEILLVRGLLFTGMRISEFLHLNKKWIDFKDKLITIPPSFKCNCNDCKKKKGIWKVKTKDSARDIYLVDEIYEMLYSFFKNYNSILELIPNRHMAWGIVKKLGEKCNLKLFPHAFRCIDPNTRIVTNEGIITARELMFLNKPSVIGIKKNMKLNFNKVKASISKRRINALEMWAGGREIICSGCHKFFVLEKGILKEKKLDDLNVGDYIAGISKIDLPNRKKRYNPDFWRIVGYFVGDGTLVAHGISFSDKNIKILKFYKQKIEKLFHKSPSIFKIRNEKTNTNSLRYYDVHFNILMEKHFEIRNGSRFNKRVPKELYSCSNEEIIQFIAGFYDAEGNNYSLKTEQQLPVFYSSCKSLLKDVQSLLLLFGISSNLSYRYMMGISKKEDIYYELKIGNIENTNKFLDLIPTLKKIKRKRDIGSKEKIPCCDLITELYSLRKGTKKKLELRAKKGRFHIKRYCTHLPSKNTLLRLLKNIDMEELCHKEKIIINRIKKLINSDLKWLQIKEINYLDTRSLIDFSVENKNFVTDGILSHNSTFGTILASKDFSPFEIAGAMGWSDPSRAKIYIKMAGKRIKKAFQNKWKDKESERNNDER